MPRLARLLRRLVSWQTALRLLILALTVALASGAWLVATEGGARFAIAWVSGLVPDFRASHAGGTLLGPLQLRDIVIKKKNRVEIDRLAIDWAPSALLIGNLHVRELHLDRLRVKQPAPDGRTSSAVPATLPALQPPLDLYVDRVRIDELVTVRGERESRYERIRFGFDWQDEQLALDHLTVGTARWESTLAGTLTTAGEWPLEGTLQAVLPRDGDTAFKVEGRMHGTVRSLRLALDSRGLLDSRIDAQLSPLAAGLPFAAQLSAAQARVPPRAAPERAALLRRLALQANGELLGTFTLTGSADLDTPWTEPVPVTLRATGSRAGLERAEVTFVDPRFDATLVTDYRWLGGQQFRGTLQVRRLDLALANPRLRSQLAGTLRVEGRIPPAPLPGQTARSPRFDLLVESLAGTLQQRAVTIAGPLHWQDGRWTFEDLDLRQGANRAVLRGTLADRWDADAALQLDDLHTLLPAFAGRAAGSAHLDGPPADPQFAFRLQARDVALPEVTLPAPLARTLHVPRADWSLQGVATLRHVRLHEARTVDAGFSIVARGDVDWAQALRWDIDSTVVDLPLAQLVDDLFFPLPDDAGDGRVSGRFASRGELGRTLAALDIDTALTGRLAARPLAVTAALDWQPGRATLHELQLQHGDNRLQAKATLDRESLALQLDADAPALQDSLRDVAGRLQAQANIDGPRDAPDARVQLRAADLHWRDLALALLDGSLALDDGAHAASNLQLQIAGLARGRSGNARIDTLQIAADGTRDAHRLETSLLSGPLALALQVGGSLGAADDHRDERTHDTLWHGTLERGRIDLRRWRWEAAGEPALLLRRDRSTEAGLAARLQLQLAPHCWSDNAARFCFLTPARLGRDGELEIETFHLPLESLLADLLPLDTLLDGRLGGSLQARWQDGRLQAFDGSLRNGEPLRIARSGDDDEDALRHIARIDTLAVQATLADGRWQAAATLAGDDAGHLQAQLSTTPVAAHAARDRSVADDHLAGEVRLNGLRVDLLEAFTYQVHRLGGTLDAALTLGGTRTAPRLAGTLALRDGRFAFTRLPLAIEAFRLDGNFDGERLTLDGAFRTPGSPEDAQLAGTLALAGGEWSATARLAGNRLAVGMLPEYRFVIAPDLQLAADRRAIVVTGDIHVPSGRIETKRLPVQSVRRSNDVIVVQTETMPGDTGGGLIVRQRVDIDLLLGDDIRFKAFGGEGRLTGALRLRSTPELPLLVDGELHVREGKYRALGQQLELRQADILFNGAVDRPLIDALAVRDIDDPAVRAVGLRLSGPLHAPQSVLWSSPELPPGETLSWLTTGQPPAAGAVDLRSEAEQAALALGMAQGSILLSEAGQEIGLRDVQLSSSGGGETSEVQVGTHVSDRVFVGYNRRVFSGEGSVMMRLQLTRRLMLEALSGVESAVDVFYTFEF
ncbi:MAG: translocation/assembly module TamB domain-containing protein [Pseudomonadota bacterium]